MDTCSKGHLLDDETLYIAQGRKRCRKCQREYRKLSHARKSMPGESKVTVSRDQLKQQYIDAILRATRMELWSVNEAQRAIERVENLR